MRLDETRHDLMALRVERRGGFVEQPDRARRSDEPRQRKTPRLPLAQCPRLAILKACKAHALQRVRAARTAKEARPVAHMRSDARGRLQRVEVRHVVKRKRGLFNAVEGDAPRARAQEPGDGPKQARLARAIGAADLDIGARLGREGEVFEENAPAARQRQRLDPQGRRVLDGRGPGPLALNPLVWGQVVASRFVLERAGRAHNAALGSRKGWRFRQGAAWVTPAGEVLRCAGNLRDWFWPLCSSAAARRAMRTSPARKPLAAWTWPRAPPPR